MTAQPLALLRFLEGGGDTLHDQSTWKRDGSITTTAANPWVRGRFGGGVSRTTATDRVLVGGSDTSWLPEADCTIIVAAKKSNPAGYNGFFGSDDAWGGGLALRIAAGTDDTNLAFDYGGAAEGSSRLSIALASLPDDYLMWNVYAFTVGARGMEIWQNGKRVASNTGRPTRTNAAYDFMVGAAGAWDDAGQQVAHFEIYDQQLSVGELVAKMGVAGLAVQEQATIAPPAPAASSTITGTGAVTAAAATVAGSGTVSSGAISISITTSRTSGAGPLSVHFDASATTAVGVTDPARDLDFHWDFDDAGSLLSTAEGCCAGHVFEGAGSYTVTLTVTDGTDGTSDTDTVSITVADADTVFSGTDTICLSIAGTFTGAPAGATQTTITDGDDINTHLAAGKRVLLNRGETYVISASVNIPHGCYLGAYGTGTSETDYGFGNDPLIDCDDLEVLVGFNDENAQAGTWICNIRTTNGSATDSVWGGISAYPGSDSTASHVLIHKCQVDDFGNGFGCNSDSARAADAEPTPYFCLSQCKATPDLLSAKAGHAAYFSGTGAMMLGCYFDGSASAGYTSHCVRVTYCHKLVIQGNSFAPSTDFSRHALKIHTLGYSSASSSTYFEPIAGDLCITENTFRQANMTWPVAVGPQDAVGTTDERISGVYIARNWTAPTNTFAAAYRICCRNVLAANNVLVSTNSGGWEEYMFLVGKRGGEPSSQAFRAYHNVHKTIEASHNNAGIVYVSPTTGDYDGDAAVVINNVACGEAGDDTITAVDIGSKACTASNNFDSSDAPGFVDFANNDFRPGTGSGLIDAGTAVPVARDYTGALRTEFSTPDIGAYDEAVAVTITGTGAVTAPAATVAASGTVSAGPATITGTGAVTAPAAIVSGSGTAVTTITGTGAITAPAAVVVGYSAGYRKRKPLGRRPGRLL